MHPPVQVIQGPVHGAGRPRQWPRLPARMSHLARARSLRALQGPHAPSRQRRWPRPIPIVFAFCRTAPSVRFIAFATSETGVLAFECVLSARKSSLVQALRWAVAIFFGIYGAPFESLDAILLCRRAYLYKYSKLAINTNGAPRGPAVPASVASLRAVCGGSPTLFQKVGCSCEHHRMGNELSAKSQLN